MASVSTQPQFRYTQPPSKVLHLRNLPWECTVEELIELGKPFGKIVNTKCNVGANHNQAFVEFEDLNQAIAMISYYASSPEPAQVRGKTVYIQYSNRQEIVNNKPTGDVAGNVLLVTIEGVDANHVTIEVLHLVFSAFGFVHKIATFEKTAGFQALVQFSDPQTARAAKDALDGRNIPSYLLPENMGPFALKMTFSAHTDLHVKFQSHRSSGYEAPNYLTGSLFWDYTNPYLPVAPSAIDGGGQFFTSHDAKKQETECDVLLVSMENMQYTVNVDVLHTVFSSFGPVQKIAIFEKNAGFHALVQYPVTIGHVIDVGTASAAKQALEGHCIYDGGFCRLHLTYSHHTDISVKVNNDRSRDYTIQNTSILNNQPSILGQQPQPPMLGTTTSPQYNNAPTGQMPGVMTAPSPIGAWNMGVGPMTQLPPQMPHGPYVYPIPSHNLPAMNSGKLQWPVPGGHLPAPPYGR